MCDCLHAVGTPLDEVRRDPIQIEHIEHLRPEPSRDLARLAIDRMGQSNVHKLLAPRHRRLRFEEPGLFRSDHPRHRRHPRSSPTTSTPDACNAATSSQIRPTTESRSAPVSSATIDDPSLTTATGT